MPVSWAVLPAPALARQMAVLLLAASTITACTSAAPAAELPASPSPTAPSELSPFSASVDRAIDGDTIEVALPDGPHLLHLAGFDAPEMAGDHGPAECLASEARRFLAQLASQGDVSVAPLGLTDATEGQLAEVRGGPVGHQTPLALAALAQGFGRFVNDAPTADAAAMKAAEAHARKARLGIWRACGGSAHAPQPTPRPHPSVRPVSRPSACHPSYRGACLKVNAGDYDCLGGSGNGPNYVAGPIEVVGPDVFGLDHNHNGIGCE